MTRIVIPYYPAGAQGRELEYAIEGWRRYFIEEHMIIVVGEGLDAIHSWCGGLPAPDVVLIESPRVPAEDGQYRQHLDYVSCLRKVRERYPAEDGFIFVADDCYAVNEFDLADVKLLKMLGPTMGFSASSANAWQRDKARTKAVLERDGYPTRNFTTHLPQWYDWRLLENLWRFYGMDGVSYVMEDLYYNIYCRRRIPFRLDRAADNFKLGVYGPMDETTIREAFTSKIWITNSPEGWSDMLASLLRERYRL